MRVAWRTTALAAAALVAATVPMRTARADILPAVSTPTVTAVVGGFNWTYDITLTADQKLVSGDFFTIYDFGVGGLVSAPVGWTLTTDPLNPVSGTSNNGLIVPTQTNALNWTFTYTGATVTGQADLGNFLLFSTSGTPVMSAFMGLGTNQGDGLRNANVTNTMVPVSTPEPASLVLLGTGMLGLVGFVRRQKRLS